jgi:hypothetical protein
MVHAFNSRPKAAGTQPSRRANDLTDLIEAAFTFRQPLVVATAGGRPSDDSGAA